MRASTSFAAKGSPSRRRNIFVAVTAVWALAAGTAIGPAFTAANAADDASDAALRSSIAGYLGVDASNVDIVASEASRYPLTKVTATTYKVDNAETSATTVVAQLANGRFVDPERLLRAEYRAAERRFGAVDQQLAQELAETSANARHRVTIWLEGTSSRIDQAPASGSDSVIGAEARQAVRADVQRASDRAVAAVAEARRPLAQALRAAGQPFVSFDGLPVLAAKLTAAEIDAVAQTRHVGMVYSATEVAPASNVVHSTAGFNITDGRSVNGTGVRLAQVEVGGYVNTSNPNLTGHVVSDSNASLCSPSSFPQHSAVVAGIIRYHASDALNLATGDCGGRTVQLFDRARAAINWGAAAVNHSWGERCTNDNGTRTGYVDGYHTDMDRTADRLVFTNRILQVMAAGNDGQTCQYVNEPAGAWNVLTVGNFDDRNTHSWTGDYMNASSSWRDPYSVYGDMDKPEVAAPGTGIDSAINSYPWWTSGSTQSGTSFAAPVYTALAGDLIERNSLLKPRPEALKAILMASAAHNIDGATRRSEYDGVGGPWAEYSDDVTRSITLSGTTYPKSNWIWQQYPCTSSTNTSWYAYFEANKRVRVASAWSTNPDYQYYTSQPSADLDLRVYRYSDGAFVQSSTSYDNAWEILDFIPAVAGYYRIEVRKVRCSSAPAGLGVAWWQNR